LTTPGSSETTRHIIASLADDETFRALSAFEADAIVKRDEEDAEKLQAGIQVVAHPPCDDCGRIG
jgi:hypothetical protein